jgi:hypothetical protein
MIRVAPEFIEWLNGTLAGEGIRVRVLNAEKNELEIERAGVAGRYVVAGNTELAMRVDLLRLTAGTGVAA